MTQDVVELDNLAAGDDPAVDTVLGRMYQQIKIVDGTLDSTTPAAVGGGVEANALRVTLASDSTGVVNLGATDNAVLDSIATATELIDDAVLAQDAAGSGAKVMMAGAIRDDALTTLTPIDGDAVPLRVGSTGALHVTGGGGGTEYTEDVATANPQVGTATMIERDDALSAVTPVEGDWIGLRGTAEGALWTQDFNSDQMRADLTSIAAAMGGTYADDAAFTLTSSEGVAVMGIRDDTLTTLAAAENDTVPLRVSSTGALHVTGGGGGTEYVENVALGATPTGSIAMARQDAVLSATGSVDDDAQPLHVDANGALWVIPSGTVTVDGSGVTQPVSGTVTANLSATDNAVLDTIDGVLDTINAKLVTGTVIGDVNLGATDNAVLDDIAAQVTTVAAAVSTEMQVDVVGSLPAGTNAIGKLAANSGIDIGDVDVTSISAGSNLIGDVGVGVRTSGGATPKQFIDVDESEDEVKGSAGQLYWIHAINLAATTVYLKVYNNTAAGTTVGTTTPIQTYPVPPNSTTGGGFVMSLPMGMALGTGITIAGTTGVAVADTGAPATNSLVVNVGYA